MARTNKDKEARERLNDDLRARPGGPIGKSRKQKRRREELEAIQESMDLTDDSLDRIREAFGYEY